MRIEESIEILKHVPWKSFRVRAVVLYGSVAKGSKCPRDIDLLVVSDSKLRLEDEVRMAEIVEARCGLEADIAVITLEDPDCELLLNALEEGVLIYVDDGEGVFSRAIALCYDYLLMKRKVRYTETLIDSVIKGAPIKTR